MNPLLVVLPCHNGDVELAKRLLVWINELDEYQPIKQHTLLLAYDSAVPLETAKELAILARKTFRVVNPLSVTVNAKDWRVSNEMFRNTLQWIKATYRSSFLWMEPDCVPLRMEWLDDLAIEYSLCPKNFMGAMVESTQEGLPPLHMTGCGIYPANAIDLLEPFCNNAAEFAWDIASAKELAGQQKAQHTPLIQSFWGQKDLPPTFVEKKEPGTEYPLNTLDLSFIKMESVLFHRCKDGSLITALRARAKRHAVTHIANWGNAEEDRLTPQELLRVEAAIALSNAEPQPKTPEEITKKLQKKGRVELKPVETP